MPTRRFSGARLRLAQLAVAPLTRQPIVRVGTFSRHYQSASRPYYTVKNSAQLSVSWFMKECFMNKISSSMLQTITVRIVIAVALFLTFACDSTPQSDVSKAPYMPSWGDRAESFANYSEGSLGKTFHWACASKDLKTAAERWEKFLLMHGPFRGAYEDAVHRTHVIYARQELMRIYYLLGRVADGDRLMRLLDPMKG